MVFEKFYKDIIENDNINFTIRIHLRNATMENFQDAYKRYTVQHERNIKYFLRYYFSRNQTERLFQRKIRAFNGKEAEIKNIDRPSFDFINIQENLVFYDFSMGAPFSLSYKNKANEIIKENLIDLNFRFKLNKKINKEDIGSIYFERIFSILAFLNLILRGAQKDLKKALEKAQERRNEKSNSKDNSLKNQFEDGLRLFEILYIDELSNEDVIKIYKRLINESVTLFLRHEKYFLNHLTYLEKRGLSKEKMNKIEMFFLFFLGDVLGTRKYSCRIIVCKDSNFEKILKETKMTFVEFVEENNEN